MDKKILFLLGLLLFIEGFFLQINWAQWGVQSIVLGTFWLHHWIIGIAIMIYAAR